MCPLIDIKVHKYLNWSLCLSLSLLICGNPLFRLTTISYVFLLFNSNLFFLRSSLMMSIESFFYFPVSSACLKLFMLCPLALILDYPSSFHIIISLQREKRSGESTHPFLTPCFIFLNELITPSTLISSVCSQYMFMTTCRLFPLIFNCISCVIISFHTLSNAMVLSRKHSYTSFRSLGAWSFVVREI